MAQRTGTRFDAAKEARAIRFATELADALYELSITHRQLARQLGVTVHAVDSWTRSTDPAIPGKANLDKLCTLLEVRESGRGSLIAKAAGHDWHPEADPPKADDIVPTNLPIALTSFVGRAKQIEELGQLLLSTRLLTLTGAGGIGKTRLAIEAARRLAHHFQDGVRLVEFASITDPTLVPQVTAIALSVPEHPGRTTTDVLIQHLSDRRLLLVLDNCEHLVGVCALLAEQLLHSCPGITILATSRETLQIPGEAAWRVPPLHLPTGSPHDPLTPESLMICEATRLFIERARFQEPGFELTPESIDAVARICRILDGIPLAIELAAANVRFLSVAQIAHRLKGRLDLLTGGSRTSLPRHQTLRAALDWSFDLLSPAEQILFSRLSVFVGGWSLEAAEAVTAGGESLLREQVVVALRELAYKSLVLTRQEGEDVRYLLLEPVRAYAQAHLLAAGETEAWMQRHAAYYRTLIEGAAQELRSPKAGYWTGIFERDYDNVRAALHWAREHGELDSVLRMSSSLQVVWTRLGRLQEAREWLDWALARSDSSPAALRAYALNTASVVAINQDDLEAAKSMLAQSRDLWKSLADNASAPHSGLRDTVNELGMITFTTDAEAHTFVSRQIVNTTNNLGIVAVNQYDYPLARHYYEECLRVRRLAEDKAGTCSSLYNLGSVAFRERDYTLAKAWYGECMLLIDEVGNNVITSQLYDDLGMIALKERRYDEAEPLMNRGLAAYRELKTKKWSAQALLRLGVLSIRRKDYVGAIPMLKESLTLARSVDETRLTVALLGSFALVETMLRQSVEANMWAVRLIGASAALLKSSGLEIDPPDAEEYVINVAEVRSAVNPELYEESYAEGRAMSLDHAVSHALTIQS